MVIACHIGSKHMSMGPVLIWPRILVVTSGILYKHKRNLNYIEDIRYLIVSERCTNYHICRIFILPDFPYFLKYSNTENLIMLEICKSENCENT